MSVDTDQEGLICYQFRDGALETAVEMSRVYLKHCILIDRMYGLIALDVPDRYSMCKIV